MSGVRTVVVFDRYYRERRGKVGSNIAHNRPVGRIDIYKSKITNIHFFQLVVKPGTDRSRQADKKKVQE
jgi:hypothetical protein